MSSVFIMIIIGAAAGFMATRVMHFKANPLTTVLIGMIGGLVGGLISRTLMAMVGWMSGFIGAFLGAMLLIWLWRKFTNK